MQRANCISRFYVGMVILCLSGTIAVSAEQASGQAKADMKAKKATATKAAEKARATAKAVQKAQDDLAAKRLQADKLQETATADKAKLTAALGRNAGRKELEKLTQAAHKSAGAARKAGEESEKASAD